MTPRDPELLELLRDEPELLAIVDASQQTLRVPARRRRRAVPSRRAGVLLAAAAVILAAVLGQRLLQTGPSFSERAVAALGAEPILHLQLVTDPAATEVVDLETGDAVPDEVRIDAWADRAGGRTRFAVRRAGTFQSQASAAATGLEELAASYRKLLQAGELEIVPGEDEVDGHEVRWVALPASGGLRASVAIDAQSHRPVALRTGSTTRLVTRAETVSRQLADSQYAQVQAARSGQAVPVRALTPDELGGALGSAPTLWLGPAGPDGLPLQSRELETLTLSDGSGAPARGLLLRYGRDDRPSPASSQPYVLVQQSTQLHPAYGFLPRATAVQPEVPPGRVLLEVRPATNRASRDQYFARLEQDGVAVQITASSRRLALEAARRLQRVGA